MTIKAHTIILPSFSNEGGSIEGPRNRALEALAHKFGGLTSWPALGHWRNPQTGAMLSEAVTVHKVAFDGMNAANAAAFLQIAGEFARDAGQQSVYVEHADGRAEFVSPAPPHVATGHVLEREGATAH